MHENAYVASVSLSADVNQTVKAGVPDQPSPKFRVIVLEFQALGFRVEGIGNYSGPVLVCYHTSQDTRYLGNARFLASTGGGFSFRVFGLKNCITSAQFGIRV